MGVGFVNQVGAFTTADQILINQNFALLAGLAQGQGTVYFVDAVNGKDFYNGLNPTPQADGISGPKQTLQGAYNACVGTTTSGQNDTVAILANGATSGTLRVDNAFTWAKNETHLVGLCSPVLLSQRARLAPSSTTTAFANFFTLTGSGCVFQNVQIVQGFTTGTTAEICVTLSAAHRNYFKNCHIAGMAETASATDTGSRSLKISASDENVFESCTIGLDTVARTVANASLELASDAARNVFRDSLFPFWATGAGALGILGTGAACMDRFTLFDRCAFINSIKSGSGTAMTALASLTSAAPGGLLVFKGCISVGQTKFGDTNALANSYIDMAAVSAAAGGLAVNPS